MKQNMTTSDIRQHFLSKGKKIIKRQEWFACKSERISPGQQQMFEGLMKIIEKSEDPITMSFTEGDIGVKINDILESVSQGKITPSEAQKLMELVRSGFEMTEIRELAAQMQKAGLLER